MAVIMASLGATAFGRARDTRSVFDRISCWYATWQQHRPTRKLDAHLCRDLGIIDWSAGRAATRPGWDVSLPGLR